MEHLLNLLWLLVASGLVAVVLREHRRGNLRCSLRVALACTALIALALFPAMSMTDDLARAKLYEETNSGHSSNMLLLRSLEDAPLSEALLLPGMLLLLWLALLICGAERFSRATEFLPSLRLRGAQPFGVRPPPAALVLAR